MANQELTYHGRFSGLEWYGDFRDITVGGVGGIGSYLVFFLSRIGHKLHIYDHDMLDESNIAGQLFDVKSIGNLKTAVIKKICKDFSNHNNISSYGKFTESSWVTPITMSCFDNMASRKIMFEKWKNLNTKDKVYIDARMNSEYGEVYCVTPDRTEQYEATLFDDSEAPDMPCSARATSHCGAIVAGFMTSVFNNWFTNHKGQEDKRVIPFKLTMDLVLFMNEVDLLEPSKIYTDDESS